MDRLEQIKQLILGSCPDSEYKQISIKKDKIIIEVITDEGDIFDSNMKNFMRGIDGVSEFSVEQTDDDILRFEFVFASDKTKRTVMIL